MTTLRARYHDEWRGLIRQAMTDGSWHTVDELTQSVFGQWGRERRRLVDLLHGMLDVGEVETDRHHVATMTTRYRLRQSSNGLSSSGWPSVPPGAMEAGTPG